MSRQSTIFSPLAFRAQMTDESAMVCTYPISGQYGLLPRLQFYLLAIFGISYRHRKWLVAGALASTLTSAGSAAIHAIILAFFRDKTAVDLDIIPCGVILAQSILIALPLHRYSQSCSKARPVLLTWLSLVIVGMVVAVTMGGQTTEDRKMASGDLGTGVNCTYTCLQLGSRLRQCSDMETINLQSLLIFRMLIFVMAAQVSFVTYGLYSTTLFSALLSYTPLRSVESKYRHLRGLWSQVFKWPLVAMIASLFAINCAAFEFKMLSLSLNLPLSEPPQDVGQWSP